ncbi:MAG: AMP-binding protein [Bacteroidia bacterium]|nr:AMP-binding protein [Bacteroidia bacterium]
MPKFNTPLEAFLYWEKHHPDKIFLKQPINGKTVSFSFREAGDQARKIAKKISEFNFTKLSHIALLSKNCAHWILSDIAIMMAGHVSIPIYPTLNAKSIKQILEHSESKALIIGKLDDFASQKAGVPDIPKISIGMYGEDEGELWEDIVKNNEPLKNITEQNLDDLITIIYTSGTTGNPKGVMHTVGNFMESTNTLIKLFALPQHLRLFSYLPLAHVAERLIANSGTILGATTSFTESLDTFAKDLEKTQPHIFFAVPRIWTKFQDKILENLPQKKLSIILKIPVLNRIFINKLKYKLGLKEAIFICSAAAPIASSLIKWYKKLGITIQQGYGMTEDCCVSHFNLPNASKIGTVGKALFNVDAKLSPEGEICVKNPCLMKGYFKSPEMTAAVFDDEGYLKTGDIGEYDHDGFLTITGRVKDQFKTDKGKYISPGPLELEMEKNTNIEQICIVGTGIPQPLALVTLSELGKSKSKEELVDSLYKALTRVNPLFEKHEHIDKVVVMKEDWNVANGLTTPTLKVKRIQIEKIHKQFYQEWFAKNDKVIFE